MTSSTGEDSEAISKKKSTPFSFLIRYPIFDSFQFRNFRWVWWGALASFMALNMQMITRGWLVLRLADESPLALTIVMMSFSLPLTFMSLIGGALADRIPKKKMVMVTLGATSILTLLLATLDITGIVTLWHLLVIGVANGSMMALNLPSRQTLISEIVPESNLMNAVSLTNSGMNLTRVVGPAVAGILIMYIGTAGVFYLITGIYLFAVLSMAMVHTGDMVVRRPQKSVTRDIREGVSYVMADPTLRGLIIMAFITTLFGFTYFPLLPAWGREALDVQSDGLGVLMALMGVGALVGTLMLASLRRLNSPGALLLVNSVLWGGALAAFSQVTSFGLAIPLLMFVGLVSAMFLSLNMTMLQLHASPDMRGRVVSIGMMSWGVMSVSAVPFGALAEHIGTPDALFFSGVLLVCITLLFAVGVPSFRKME